MPEKIDEAVLSEFRPMLGRVPDRHIANQAGVSRAYILAWRRRLGVQPYQGYKFGAPERSTVPRAQGGAFRGRRSRLDQYQELLGKVPDAEIALKAGVTSENVRMFRERRGIPAEWRSSGAAQVQARAPRTQRGTRARAEKAPAQPKGVYAIGIQKGEDTSTAYILAKSPQEAIALAGPAVDKLYEKARILGVKYVGMLLE